MLRNQIINCDCVAGMAQLRAESVPSTITSPPYDDIRTYGGHGWNFGVFRNVADQLWRITMPGGVVCWVVQDRVKNGRFSGTKLRQAQYFMDLGFALHHELTLVVKDFRPCKNRYRSSSISTGYVFSKGKPHYVHIIEDRPNVSAGKKARRFQRSADGSMQRCRSEKRVPPYGFRSALWQYTTGEHLGDRLNFPALMLEAMAEDLIVSFSRPGEIVLDPFSGAGTTAKMALLNCRDYLGFEIWSKAYPLCQHD
jgi:DNA modification methylase